LTASLFFWMRYVVVFEVLHGGSYGSITVLIRATVSIYALYLNIM
jgi:hypothetical protein